LKDCDITPDIFQLRYQNSGPTRGFWEWVKGDRAIGGLICVGLPYFAAKSQPKTDIDRKTFAVFKKRE
jgi:hypothetical protein